MTNPRYCIIMAGGVGSRFWPLSKNNMPKQFLDVLGTGKSFIRATFERFLPVVPAENFVVVTNAAYKELVLQHLPELKAHQVLCEPMRRNTAPCIAYATYHIMAQCADATVVVSPSDHLVTNEAEFQRVINAGCSFVEQPAHSDALLTIGIRPSRPETGYGYIEVAPSVLKESADEVVPMTSFKEKPDLTTAEHFLAAGNFFWNSGIFIWTQQGILNAFRQQMPDLVTLFDSGSHLFGTNDEQQFINDNFARCQNISIDYGIMEHAPVRYTIPADFGWSDIGTYGSLYTHSHHDDNDNAVSGDALLVDSHRNVVNIENGIQAIVQGMDDCLVVLRNGALLVCRMNDEQHIKEWVEHL
ncbi:MAG: mannose-1-phosphate guanylyltransferase [Bacteroidales bacterium]|nr:mannose-1-phosphate guanylyltransferase [Bacteroidales bacterium]